MKVKGFFKNAKIKFGLMGFGSAVFIFGLFQILGPVYREFQTSFAARDFKKYGVLGTYQKRFFDFAVRIDEMRMMDEENVRLSEDIAVLEKELTLKNSHHDEVEAKKATDEIAEKLKKESGSELARALDSIDYQVPGNLLPLEIYTLGLGYFRKGEYEQSAVIFSKLMEMKNGGEFQKPENYLMCGISWYKLKEFTVARRNLKLAQEKSRDDSSVHRKAILWEALVAQAMGKKSQAQDILTEMVAKFPHSEEVRWVNGKRTHAVQPSAEPANRDPAHDHDRINNGSVLLSRDDEEPQPKVVTKEEAIKEEVIKEAPSIHDPFEEEKPHGEAHE